MRASNPLWRERLAPAGQKHAPAPRTHDPGGRVLNGFEASTPQQSDPKPPAAACEHKARLLKHFRAFRQDTLTVKRIVLAESSPNGCINYSAIVLVRLLT